jgi:hypothetical protein
MEGKSACEAQLIRLHQILKQPYLGWHPHLTSMLNLVSQSRQAKIFILASLPLAVITRVPHSLLNGSAGVPAVPATISMCVKAKRRQMFGLGGLKPFQT